MADDVLVEQLMTLQVVAKERKLLRAWRWLGKQIHELLSTQKPKRKRPRGRWVRLAATGERAMLDADLVARALKENQERLTITCQVAPRGGCAPSQGAGE